MAISINGGVLPERNDQRSINQRQCVVGHLTTTNVIACGKNKIGQYFAKSEGSLAVSFYASRFTSMQTRLNTLDQK